MARYLIPPGIVKTLVQLGNIKPDVFQQFVSEIDSKLIVNLGIERDIEQLVLTSEFLDIGTPTERLSFAEAVTAIHYLRLHPRKSDQDLLNEIETACGTEGVDSTLSAQLAANVRALLGAKVLRASIKAWSLVGDHERTYLGSRVITDCRPVFEDNVGDGFLASLVIHTLKISTRIDGKTQNVFLAADSEDLHELKENIDRALSKAQTLAARINEGAGWGKALDVMPDDGENYAR